LQEAQNERLRKLVSALKDKLDFLELFFKDEYRLFEGLPQGNYSREGYCTCRDEKVEESLYRADLSAFLSPAGTKNTKLTFLQVFYF